MRTFSLLSFSNLHRLRNILLKRFGMRLITIWMTSWKRTRLTLDTTKPSGYDARDRDFHQFFPSPPCQRAFS